MTLVLIVLIGFFAGLRSLTAPAVTAWAAHLGWLHLDASLSWIGSTASVAIFTILAVAELVADKLPNTPSRTAPVGLIARILTGGLCGACVAVSGGYQAIVGAMMGAVGGVLGCYGGYQGRTRLVKRLRTPDYVVAVVEDLISIGGSVWVMSQC